MVGIESKDTQWVQRHIDDQIMKDYHINVFYSDTDEC